MTSVTPDRNIWRFGLHPALQDATRVPVPQGHPVSDRKHPCRFCRSQRLPPDGRRPMATGTQIHSSRTQTGKCSATSRITVVWQHSLGCESANFRADRNRQSNTIHVRQVLGHRRKTWATSAAGCSDTLVRVSSVRPELSVTICALSAEFCNKGDLTANRSALVDWLLSATVLSHTPEVADYSLPGKQ